jgi:hypothetical protein
MMVIRGLPGLLVLNFLISIQLMSRGHSEYLKHVEVHSARNSPSKKCDPTELSDDTIPDCKSW